MIVALDGRDVLVVRQHRPGAGGATLELPSGKVEQGEDPAEAAARELAEECACGAREWRRLGGFWAAPAYSTEFVHVFEASGLETLAVRVPADEDEALTVERRAADAAQDLADASSIAALALWRATQSG